ncbi:MAG: 7-carboxy-7-deazaguanine synthase QueE [Bacteroidia bacterium]
MEIFYTIQGEGAWSGNACYFVRMAGCDVGCVWCDVKESWDASQFPALTTDEIIKKFETTQCKMVVITGGEPAMYDLTDLTTGLKNKGYKVHVETSGAYELKGDFDWVCFSPKKFKKPIENFGAKADELKVIVFNKSDFEWAENYRKDVKENCKLYLQPEWDKRETVKEIIVDYVKNNPEWKVSLQTHKYLEIP